MPCSYVVTSLREGVDLLARVSAGDRDAFTALVQPHLPALLGFAIRLAPSHAAAEDALQDVLAQAYATLQRKPVEDLERLKVRPWLFKSVINRLRRVGRRLRETATGLAVSRDTAEDVQAAVDRRALLAQVEHELVKLPSGWRAAILLRHQNGYGYEEIAAILGRPSGTVKAWVHRGTQRVRAALIGQHPLEDL